MTMITIVIPQIYPGGAETVSLTLCQQAAENFQLVTLRGENPFGQSFGLKRNRDILLYAIRNSRKFKGQTLLLNMTEVIAYGFVFRLIGVKYYVRLANPKEDFEKFTIIKKFIIKVLSYISIQVSCGVVFNSVYTANSFKYWVKRKKSVQIYNPIKIVDTEVLPKNGAKQIDLLWIGRFEAQKDPASFIELICTLRDKFDLSPTAMMIGSGSMRKNIETLLFEKKLEGLITIIDPVHHRRLWHFYEMSKVYVNTSEFEGFGNTIVEAYLAGCKIWIKNTGGSLLEIKDLLGLEEKQDIYNLVNLLKRQSDCSSPSVPNDLDYELNISKYIGFLK